MTQRVFYLLTVPDGADPTLWVPPGTCTITPVRCETCKFWIPWESGDHGCARTGTTGSDLEKGRMAGVDPGGVDPAILITDSDFGCVQWEAKE
jgi:hypothetical protein